MNVRRSIILLISLLCVLSCTTTRRSDSGRAELAPGVHERLVAQPREVVLSGIQTYMAERKWPLVETDADKGIIRSGAFQLDPSRDYVHCRSGRRSTVSHYNATITIELHRVSANGTNLVIDSRVTAITEEGSHSDCFSTGRLEDEVVAGIDSLVTSWRK